MPNSPTLDISSFPPITYSPATPTLDTVQSIDWQHSASQEIIDKLSPTGTKKYRGVILRGSTGLGKMYITAHALKLMVEQGLLKCPPGSINPIPILWICPKSLKTQTMRCLKEYGIIHLVMVMSYGQIKNKDGTDMFLGYRTSILPNGQPTIDAEWFLHMRPALVVCDEIQKVKNWDAMISNVILNIPDDVLWIGMSATPWQRVSDSKVHLVRCGVVTGKYNVLPCTKATVNGLVRDIASPKSPEVYSPSAVQRLREAIEDYIVELKNVRFKFQTKTTVESISFKNSAEQQAYQKAYDDYIREMWEVRHVRKEHRGVIKLWVAMQKFQQKAEFIRCGEVVERAIQRVKEGKQVIIGSNYVETLRQCWRIYRQLGMDESRLAFIVGKQTETERQEQLDKYQAGDADILLGTVRTAGCGISCHHDRVTSRPRHIILPFCWSAIDLAQFLGRGHRLTSLSPTTQEILAYKGTVEDRVGEVLKVKVKCISKSVAAKEQFMTLFEKSAEEDIDLEESDAINEVITEERVKSMSSDVDSGTDDEAVTGEGLDSVDELPTSYR